MTTEPTFEKTKTTMCDRVCGDHRAALHPAYRGCRVDPAFCDTISSLEFNAVSLRSAYNGYRRFSAFNLAFRKPFIRQVMRLTACQRDSLLLLLESHGAAERDVCGNWLFRRIAFTAKEPGL